ncbi:hypothetical protein [Microbacterium sp. p3-SID131]|uniref:hypothetical protein n=1 Tax=Microbacterium sp. p3-SID131 TaxID=2916215 RepID=UPI0021A5B7EE|nr:hypothetical protein [Microbacterium sp. p3-SID131]MCT1363933.1 hypothetical protein [Microbacterium sp. p3-SID131]
MNIQETTELLTRIQVIDNRRVEEATVLAWFELVDDLDLATALEAVRLHFRESTAYLTPAHVRVAVERIRLAGLGPQQDEYGNDIEPDYPAVAAYERLHPEQKAINS